MSARTRERLDLAPLPVYAPPVPQGATWNGLRRLWMVDGVAVDPQPAAPRDPVVEFSLNSGRHYGPASALPPAVKVSA